MTNNKVIATLCAVTTIASGCGVQAAEPPIENKPNVLFVLIDDFGWKDVGYNGSTFYETPELDKLSKDFMRFDRCYTPSPMCSPTRVSIMTGKNPARHGVTQWLPGKATWPNHPVAHQRVICKVPKSPAIKNSEVTLGEALQKVGYETAFYGKWHMGPLKKTGGPKAHGFDSQMAVIEANRCAMFYPFRGHPEYFPAAKEGDNFTDLLTNNAIEFVSKKRDKPFFLYLAHFAMHAPIASKPELEKKFAEKARKLSPMSEDELKVKDSHAHQPYNRRQQFPDYAGELATLDENIGKLIQSLKDTGQYDNTIIFITGDNGGRTAFFHSSPTAVQPLRAGKTFTFEGGLRTPLLIHWPGATKPGMHTQTSVTSTDFYPTILGMLGLPLQPEQHKDGVSLLPLFKDRKLSRNAMYWHFPHYQGEGSYPSSAIRQDDFKLIVNYHLKDVQLFNVVDDIGETNDLAGSMPEKVKVMRNKLMDYLKETGAHIPTDNPRYNPKAKPIPAKKAKDAKEKKK
ncbi:sulfatase [Verrucomicrobiaceae bacterium N1E253]|uniref:Sulfatase n=1 Tax=Oceaniferula marina TaxID=2748318 RepID=A0A851GKK9_9BACT|nr:sulfatase [Oceaniferula marina]NWK55260.1 sulfatase [Oceaniferula marina]